ncbi:MAG: menaquinone biosynthesis protein [Deltaproteobacteria bacterium]|nr:menaquinone biosynthesis protein [Deltaproteobacteria bacterium]
MKRDKMTHDKQTRVRIGRISYINVDPIYYGLETQGQAQDIEIIRAPPAELNRRLALGALDISSVSSAAYAKHQHEWQLLPGQAIACSGNVMSVLLVSRLPLAKLERQLVAITDESATAAALIQLMFVVKGLSPRFEIKKVQSPADVTERFAAALVIGDAALRHQWHQSYQYVWDLGDLWAQHAGLPFVFAVWAVRRSFAAAFPQKVSRVMELFQKSKQQGITHLSEVVRHASQRLGIDPGVCRQYFENFCFELGPMEINGLETFFNDLFEKKIFPEKIRLSFFNPML